MRLSFDQRVEGRLEVTSEERGLTSVPWNEGAAVLDPPEKPYSEHGRGMQDQTGSLPPAALDLLLPSVREKLTLSRFTTVEVLSLHPNLILTNTLLL